METLRAIASRKSTRAFKPDQITKEELDTIVSAGATAPIAMGDFESVEITIIQNADFIYRLSLAGGELYGKPGMETLYGAPSLLLVSSKPNQFGSEVGIANAACIIENMCLAATDLEIGNVFIMGAAQALKTNESLLAELKLSAGFQPVAAVALGYSAEPLVEVAELTRRIKVNTFK